ncbi:MAG: YicC family protein [Clostridia bacterium]|nr:YicC family protein [Clostridia bacterium]
MARSMTAFGRASGVVNGKEILVEIRSVNNRYLDTNVKISRAYGALEERAKAYLSGHGVSRGKVDLTISVNVLENKTGQVVLDRAYAESYIAALRQLQQEFDLYDDISTMRVASNRDLFVFSHGEEDEEQAWQDIVTVFEPALTMFIERRKSEGENLTKDLLAKKAELMELTAKVEAQAAGYTEAYRNKLETRLRTVLQDQKIVLDESRILTECAIFADKTAVDEELVRLRSHFKAYDEIFESDEPIGRKLDFLLQEMNRETNTIGSKCSDAQTAATVVEMKCLLEKIREQIQNLE